MDQAASITCRAPGHYDNAIDSEIGYNRKELADLRRRSAEKILGHQSQIEMLTNLRAGYADLLGDN